MRWLAQQEECASVLACPCCACVHVHVCAYVRARVSSFVHARVWSCADAFVSAALFYDAFFSQQVALSIGNSFLLPLRLGPQADGGDWYSPTSDIGEYFERKRNSNEGRCKICSKKFKNSNATTLRYHAESQHRIVIRKAYSITKIE